jgi:endonuclease/exonuclease/phosphatase family metal-dependent hydrolase
VIRVVTYNIRTGLGTDGIRSIRRIAEVLASLSPDIVCVQEVDQHVPRSWLANQPKYLSTRLGMQAVFQKNVKFPTGAFGNCVLSKPGVRDCHCHPLPSDGEPRGLVQTIVHLDSRDVSVYCTHLSTDRDERIVQARAIADVLREDVSPKILCGDMNDVMGSQTLANILEDPILVDAALEMDACETPTMPESKRIDFVLPSLEFDIKSYQVVTTAASDHYPVVVDLELS